jgi:hypothetical protein
VGKILSEADRAYLAGLIDCDGAIMALIEPHREKKYKFRVRIVIKFSQKKKEILEWLKHRCGGRIRKNRTTFDWILRDQKTIYYFLNRLLPF